MPIQPETKPNPAALAHGHYEAPPARTIEELRQKLAKYDRSPFTEFLATWLAHWPKGEVIAKIAEEDVHKYVKTGLMLTQLAGFVMEKKEVQHKVSLEHMSDLELLAFVQAQRAAIPLQPIDAEATTVDAALIPPQ